MAYTQPPERTSADTNSSADYNQLQDNIEALKGGAGATPPATTIEDLSSDKADKVSGASAGNLAALDASGNLTDSGVAEGDKANIIASPTTDNLVSQTAGGDIQDSGYGVLDEDNMASDSDTDVPTQSSTKAYIDGAISSLPASLAFEAKSADFTAAAGKIYYVTTSTNRIDIAAPASPSANDEIWIIKADAAVGTIEIDFAISGYTSFDIEKQYCGIKIKYSGGAWVIVGTIGDCEIAYVNSALEMIYSKTLTGTTDNDSSTSFSTGLPTGYKIVSVGGGVVRAADSIMFFYDSRAGSSTANQFNLYDNSSGTFTVDDVGNSMRVSEYRITIKYYI